MKYLFLSLLVTYVFAMPDWYGNIKNDDKSIYIGYGESNSENDAKQNALNDIASQISTDIDYSFRKEIESSSTKYRKNVSKKSTQKMKVTLNDWELLRLQKDKNKFYVAIKYENIPSLDKFAKKTNLKKEDIVNSIKRDFGKSLGLELVRKDKKWYIKYQNILQILEKRDFEKFFVSKEHNNLLFGINKNRNILYNGDKFRFRVKSKKDGFVTILDIYEDGTVIILYKNIKISKDKYQNIPDSNSGFDPIAGLIDNNETIDLYVALFSEKKVILDEFAMADEDFSINERYKNFDELISFLKDKIFSSIKVIIKPRR